jgi:hypothetical protein
LVWPGRPENAKNGGELSNSGALHAAGVFPVELGTVLAGTSVSRTLTFTNRGAEATRPGPVAVSHGEGLALSDDACTGSLLHPGQSCTVLATAHLSAPGPWVASVRVAHSGNPVPDVFNFSATVQARHEQLVASPQTLDFGATGVGEPVARSLEVTNTGNVDAPLADLFLHGPAAAAFALDAQACPAVLEAQARCTLGLTFAPSATGAANAQLRVRLPGGTSVALAALVGTGGQGLPQFSQSFVRFVDAPQGADAPLRRVTLSNVGNARLRFGALALEGDAAFRLAASSCASELAVGQSCTADLTVRLPDAQPRVGALRLAQIPEALRQVSTVELLAQPAPAQPALQLVPATLDFGAVAVGQSAEREVELRSSGSAALSVSAHTLLGAQAGDFSVVNPAHCSGVLPPGQACRLLLRFAPQGAPGARLATLRVASTSASAPPDVALAGNAVVGDISASPLSLDFGVLTVGQSAERSVTLTSTGAVAARVDTVGLLGAQAAQFSTTGCAGQTLAPGASCTVTVRYAPTQVGAAAATLRIAHSGASAQRDVALTTQGALAPAQAQFTTSDVATQVGTAVQVSAVLTNTGGQPLGVSPVGAGALSGAGFTWVSHTCPASLASGASCTLTARCAAAAAGAHAATFTVNTSAGPRSARATCTAQPPSAVVANPHAALTTAMGTGSRSGNWRRVTNTGIGPLSINSFAPAAGTLLEHDAANPAHCRPGLVLAAGASCDVFERFERSALPSGARVSANGLTSAVSTSAGALSWTSSVEIAGVSATLAPEQGPLQRGTPGEVRLRLINNAAHDLIGATYTLTGAGGSASGCPATLPAGASCMLSAPVTPAAAATSVPLSLSVSGRYAQVINGVAQAALHHATVGTASLAVSVSAPAAAFTPAAHLSAHVGAASQASHTLTNTGAGPITVGAPNVGAGAFTVEANTCPAVLAAGAACHITTRFAPTAPGPAAATLSLPSQAGLHSVALNAAGTLPSPLVSASANFGEVAVGRQSLAQAVQIRNGSPTPMAVSALGLPSGVARAAAAPGDCAAGNFSLAPWASCALRLQWTAPALGAWAGTAVLHSNYPGAAATAIPLVGVGAPRVADFRVDLAPLGVAIGTGSAHTLSITVRNLTAPGAANADTTPPQASLATSLTPAQGASVQPGALSCVSATPGASCANPAALVIPPGGQVVLSKPFTTGAELGELTAHASVSALGAPLVVDPVPANNSASTAVARVEHLPTEKVCAFTSRQVGPFLGFGPMGANGSLDCARSNIPGGDGWLHRHLFDGWGTFTWRNPALAQDVQVQCLSRPHMRWRGSGATVSGVRSGSMTHDVLPQVQVWNGTSWVTTWHNLSGGNRVRAVLNYCAAGAPCSGGFYVTQPGRVRPIGAGNSGIWQFEPVRNAQGQWTGGARPVVNYASDGWGEDGQFYRQVWIERSPGPNCAAPGTTRVDPGGIQLQP